MDLVITEKTKELLDSLKEQIIGDFKKMNLPETIKFIESFDYNDMIMLLHLGFSEKALYESLRGVCIKTPFSLTKTEVAKIQIGLRDIMRGT